MVGYELLFRETADELRFTANAENATSTIIDTLMLVGLDVLCDGQRAFINCTHQMLLKEYIHLLPSDQVVVEVQETVPADEGTVGACQRLKQAGYAIALDNFAARDPREPLVPLADFIKVDTRKVAADQCASLAARYASKQRRMLAQKVEARIDFLTARKNGFALFQGYFFRHPERMRARQMPANQATRLRMLQAISKPEVNFAEIEDLVKHDASLCYRLLRYLNSPLLGLSSPVLSVRHALNLLGERELVRWLRMATTLVMGEGKSSDLVLSSLVRARFCELMAPKVEHGQSDLFLMGMLSLIDVILETPMGVVVDGLALDADTKAQLVGGKTRAKTPLSAIYDLMVAREAGDWESVTALGKRLNLSLCFMAETYNEAMRWAHQVTSAGKPA